MPSPTPPAQRDSSSPRDATLLGYDQYIDAQIRTTRRMVKAVEITTILMATMLVVLAFLLMAAVVEHWLVPGGFSRSMRGLLFVLLAGGTGYYLVRRLGPLCVRPISPVYAAQAIENSSPTLKNSLLNLLLFQQRRGEITPAVYETLEEQAAQRLVRVPVDAAVDRTLMIRLGYVLVAVVAVAAAYKIFSPKDPLVTAERVLMPWADIVPASRVSISQVQPGDTTLARGESLEVSADVRGLGPDDPVYVRYTTADGQAVDRPVQLTPSSTGLRFVGQVPDASQTDAGQPPGVVQNLRYYLEAGDARSLEYAVDVVAAPTITIERVTYDYPEYTGFADRSVEGLGDLRAIEGTRVTLDARANGPIDEAYIDFEADGRRDVRMEIDGQRARGTFRLALRDDRRTPRFTSYVLRYRGTDGRPNRDPVKFPIDVVPDYPPEAAILSPEEKLLEVRLDEAVPIELEARDPDFALREVRLRGEVAGQQVVDRPLLEGEHRGRFTERVTFTPSDHDLQAGDVLRYWVAAHDNRAPTAGQTKSRVQSLRILSPDPNQPPPDRRDPRDQSGDQQDRPNRQQDQQQSADRQGEAQPGGGQPEADQRQPDNAPQPQEQDQPADRSPHGQQDRGQENQDQQPADEPAAGDPESGGSAQERSEPSAGEDSESQQPGMPGGESQQSPPSETAEPGSEPAGGQPGASTGAADGQGDTADRPVNPADRQPADRPGGGNQRQRTSPRGPRDGNDGGEPSPVSPDGDNDGEAFERIREFLQREGALPDEDRPRSDTSHDPSPPDAGPSPPAEGRDSPQPPDQQQRRQPGDGASSDSERSTSSAEDRSTDQSTDGAGSQREQGQPPNGADTPTGSDEPDRAPGHRPTPPSDSPDGNQRPEIEPGTAEAEPRRQPRQSPPQDAPADSRSQRESDTEGEAGGDRSGGGEQGSGQQAHREGSGSSGQNQSADEGRGQSAEEGDHDAPAEATGQEQADRPTGREGQQRGEGSRQQQGAGQQRGPGDGAEDGGENRDRNRGEDTPARSEGRQDSSAGDAEKQDPQAGSQPSEASETDSQPDRPTPQQRDNGEPRDGPPPGQPQHPMGDSPSGSDQPGGSLGEPSDASPGTGRANQTDATAPAADPANLEYAREQTDLVLEQLSDQLRRKDVDSRLLDELGWTEAELQEFLRRWQSLKTEAGQDTPAGDAAQRELDDALRSLGLRRGPLQQRRLPEDQMRDLSDSYRDTVPLEYQQRLRAYNQGISRSRSEAD